MIIDEQVYLEHWGVKGMKWGVRKDRSNTEREKLTPAQRRRKKAKNINRVINTVFILAFVHAITSSKGSTRVRNVKVSKPKTVKDIINEERNTQVSSLTRTFKEGHMDKQQYQNFLNILNKRYDRKIAEAL